MKYTSVFIATGLAITALIGTSAKADEAEDLLNQLASTANSTAKTGNTDDSTGNLAKTVMGYYRSYIQQINDLANDGDSPPAKTADQNSGATAIATKAPDLQTSHLQTTGLQAGIIQPGGPLKEVHLAGYPALPDVPPTTTTVTQPTAAQLQDKRRTDWEQTRVQMYYFEHPGHSPN